MRTGTVRCYDQQRGFGFIHPDDGGADIFVHFTALDRAGLRQGVVYGQKLKFDTYDCPRVGKVSADNIERV
jgi:CspA family cold shock protein